jgi:hypothetical protein
LEEDLITDSYFVIVIEVLTSIKPLECTHFRDEPANPTAEYANRILYEHRLEQKLYYTSINDQVLNEIDLNNPEFGIDHYSSSYFAPFIFIYIKKSFTKCTVNL